MSESEINKIEYIIRASIIEEGKPFQEINLIMTIKRRFDISSRTAEKIAQNCISQLGQQKHIYAVGNNYMVRGC